MTEPITIEFNPYNSDEWYFDAFCYELDSLLQPFDTNTWMVFVENFGWRNQSGYKVFAADTARDFLLEILPRADNHFFITFDHDDGVVRITNYHHDSPTGETYEVHPFAVVVRDETTGKLITGRRLKYHEDRGRWHGAEYKTLSSPAIWRNLADAEVDVNDFLAEDREYTFRLASDPSINLDDFYLPYGY